MTRSILLPALLAFFAAVTLSAAPVAFNVPAEKAPDALDLFMKQSGSHVVYRQGDVAGVRTNALVGTHEPADALRAMLKDTGLVSSERQPGDFAVGRSRYGSIEGEVRDSATTRPVTNARVAVAGTDRTTLTDASGRFVLPEIEEGSHALTISADGMQKTRVTDVAVRSGHTLTLSPISIPAQVPGVVQMEDYIVSAKKMTG